MTSDRHIYFLIKILVTVLSVFIFVTLLLWITGSPPVAAYSHIIKGAFGSRFKLGHVITVWVPLTLCAMGLLYTFRINLWNIGIEGQVIMGAIFTAGVLRVGCATVYPHLILILSFAAGVMGGALWAMGVGLLKTKCGVNEIFAGLGFNFVSQGMILYLIFGPWKRPGTASMSGTELLPGDLWLSQMHFLRFSPAGLGITIGSLILTIVLFRYTRLGLGLKAIGNNPKASILYGLKPGGYMVFALALAGGFAGLCGSIQVTGVYHRLIPAISSNYGYLGLLVVMLARYRIWPTPVIAFFFASLNVGSIQLPLQLQIDSSLGGVIQGGIVLSALAFYRFQSSAENKEV